MTKSYLTLGAIVRNEAHYIREWLAHYRTVGFEKFVIVLHRCNDSTEKQLRSLPFADDIVIEHCIDSAPQVGQYNKLCHDYRGKTEWMAFLDADEFLFCPDGRDVRDFLSEFDKYGGIIVHNYEFGSSNHVIRPEGLAITSFVHRAANEYWMHDQFKSIVRLSEFERFVSPHLAHVKGGVVREDHQIVPYENIHFACGLQKGTPSINRFIRYNHYYVRSMEDFVMRCYRGDATKSIMPEGTYSGIEAAFIVLKEAGEPLNIKQIMERINERKLANLPGLTPSATVSAALQMDMKRRGSESRFEKAGKGLFRAK